MKFDDGDVEFIDDLVELNGVVSLSLSVIFDNSRFAVVILDVSNASWLSLEYEDISGGVSDVEEGEELSLAAIGVDC